MNRQEFFCNAKWVGADGSGQKTFLMLRGRFFLNEVKAVMLNVLGMGFFKCYINGHLINPDTFLPLSSEYDKNSAPEGEILAGNRIYVPQFDITPYVKEGENTIALHFGGGWYLYYDFPNRCPQAIYCITSEEKGESVYFVSNEECKIKKSYISDYAFLNTEVHNYLEHENFFEPDFDDSTWQNAIMTNGIETEYCKTDCPADKVIRELTPLKIGKGKDGIVYDCGQNMSGVPVIEVCAKAGDEVTVVFSEEILPNGCIDPLYVHHQNFKVVSDGKKRIVQPEFVWYGFRYFEVIGEAEAKSVKEIHSDIPLTSSFECDDEVINFIFKTFAHTMLSNMHIGHPSDCPHIERRGYTGDGQLTCNAVFSMFAARKFYEKWLRDIADGQDTLTGHIQYTAPYILSGGGPGGWGSAIVEVPYRLYKHYGDEEILKEYYGNMRKYIEYLEAHSEFGLVTSDKEGSWCLGDWCAPNILYPEKDITFFDQQVFIPAPYVNTYFMVKSLDKMCEIAEIIGKEDDIKEYREKAEKRKAAIQAAYFNTFDGNFVMNVQGANVFAVDLGLGNEKTYSNMVDYYKKLRNLDTGIFGTDILIRTLFERGDGDTAVKLLKADGEQGFLRWKKNGATTFHEYWDSNRSRSHNHPMFGAVAAYIFEYILGIKQREGSAGYKAIVIEPTAVSEFGFVSGSMKTTLGDVAVSYKKDNGKIKFRIVIPEGTDAVFKYNNNEKVLSAGKNIFEMQ